MAIEKEQWIGEIEKLQAGDGQAFERLYQMTSQSAYFTALKIVKNEDDAQDVLQESYMIMLDKINDLEKPEAFLSWFHMIVANKAKELLRKNNHYLFSDPDESANDNADEFINSLEDETEAYSPAAGVEQEELRKQMLRLIDGLSDEKRTVILLYYYNDLTIRQIAESLDVNENTIKSRLFYAKRELADGVKAYEKKHGRLLAASPVALLLLALRDESAAASLSFVKSGAAASTLAAVQSGAAAAQTAATAAAGGSAAAGSGAAAAGSATAATATGSTAAAAGGAAAKILGMTVAQKVIAGAVAAAVIGGGAVGVKQAAEHLRAPQIAETSLTAQAEAAWREETEPTPSARAFAALTESANAQTAAGTEPATTAAPGSNTSVRARETTAAGSAQSAAAQTSASRAASTNAVRTTTARATTTRASTTKATTTRASTTVRATAAQEETTAAARTTTTKPTTTKPTTTKPTTTTTKPTTTTEKQTATVTITITQSGSYADTATVTVDAGDTFTFSDAKSAVAAKGYDTSFAEYSGGSLPITAEAGRSYSITIDVE